MKALLLVLLFAFACSDFPEDIVKIIECLMSSESVQTLLPKIIEAIRTGDYTSLIATLIAALPQLQEDIAKCIA